MNKKIIKSMTLLTVIGLLSGCLSELDTEMIEESIAPDQVAVQTVASQLSSDYYRSVITDGRYEIGIRASGNTNLSSAGNVLAFEEGLLRISKGVFPTDQYFLQEGQIIDVETMTSWLGRESLNNPEGLNPALAVNEAETLNQEASQAEQGEEETSQEQNNQVVVDTTSTPIYLSEIMEKNLMVETADGYALAGVMIGLAMNSTYQYTDSEGIQYEQEISLGEMRERGRSYANIIVGRLRNTAALRSVPIVVGLFRQAPSDDIVGGTYVMYGISREGNYISEWTEQNEYRVSLPIVQTADYSEQYTFFDNFRAKINNFFPHLNGVTAEALYVNDGIASLNIEIVTQFYQQSEIIALTQHVTDIATSELPQNIPVEISITSIHGPEALITRAANASQFNAHVYEQ